MKYRLTFILIITLFTITQAQNVGIGTNAPSSNAILDVASTSKGIMLPRLDDTSLVAGPTAGLLIFNKNTSSPNYYDGGRWQNFSPANALNPQDSITYTITSNAAGLVLGTFNLVKMNHSGTISGTTPSVNTITVSKYFDINSIPFKKMLVTASTNPVIECKVYTLGSAIPYFSIKLTNWTIKNEDVSISSLDGKMIENYTFNSVIIGFKDWINNQSFGWNSSTLVSTAY